MTLTELASVFELYLFNHGVTLNSGFDLQILEESLQPQSQDMAERIRLKYSSLGGGKGVFSPSTHDESRFHQRTLAGAMSDEELSRSSKATSGKSVYKS